MIEGKKTHPMSKKMGWKLFFEKSGLRQHLNLVRQITKRLGCQLNSLLVKAQNKFETS